MNITAASGDMAFGKSSGNNFSYFDDAGVYLAVHANNGHTVTFWGAIGNGSQSANFSLDGGGNAVFNASNTYTGQTQINAGNLQIGANGGISGSSAIYLGLGTTTAVSQITLANTAGGQTFSNAFTVNPTNGATNLYADRIIAGSNTTGTNTYGGTITVNNDASLYEASGGTLAFNLLQNSSTVRTIHATGPGTISLGGNTDNLNIALSVDSGTVQLAKTSSSSAHAVGNSGGTALTVNSGGTAQLAGTGGDQIYDSSGVVINSGGVFDLNGRSETINTISLNGTGISGNGALINNTGTTSTLTLNSGSTLAGSTTIAGTGNITLAGAGALTASSVTTLTYAGSGVLSLSNGAGIDNTNVHLAVNAGTVILNKSGTTVNGGSGVHAVGEVDISGGGTVQLGGSGGGEIYDGNVSTVSSGGVLDLNGQNQSFTGSGNLTINGTGISSGGALVNTNTSAASTLTGPVVLGSNSSIGGAGNFTINGVISGGTNTLTKVGAGTVQLAGSSANTYTGLTTVSTGELDLNKTAGVNAIAGDGNTATNDVEINGGTLKWLADNQVGDMATITLDSGSASLNGHTDTIGTFINNGGTFTTGAGHLTGTTASVQWTGGTSTINSGGIVEDGHIVITGGTNTVQGGSTEGLLHLLSGGVGLQMTGSTLTLNSDATTPGRLLLDGNVSTSASSAIAVIASGGNASNPGVVDTDTGTRTFTVASGTTPNGIDLSIQAKVTDSASITKAGNGAMELTGNNTYTGGTSINAGTLVVNNSAGSGTGSGSVMVNTGTLAGSGTISGSVIMSNSGSNNLAPGASPIPGSIATLHVGAVTMQSTSTLKIDILAGGSNTGAGAGSIYDSVISGGNVALNNAALAVSALSSSLAIGDKYFIVENSTNSADAYGTFASGATVTDNSGDVFAINYADNGDGGLTANDISLTVLSVVPEPSTWAVGGLAAVLLLIQIGRARSFSKRTGRS